MMPVPLGELEAKLAGDLLSWLCHERVIGSIALRNALLAVQRYPVSRIAVYARPAEGEGEG